MSNGGRLVMIKAVLSSSPTYFMCRNGGPFIPFVLLVLALLVNLLTVVGVNSCSNNSIIDWIEESGLRYFYSGFDHLGERCVDKVSSKVNRSETWVPPPINSLFFNVDRSARGSPGDVGIEGVLRDSSGKILYLFSYFMGFLESNAAEIYAIHRACSLLQTGGHSINCEVIIVSDYKVAVSWCNGDDFGNINLIDLVYDIGNFITSQEGVSIKFMPRGGNYFADGLTKLGSSRSGERLRWGVF
ncbi:hypothetical protein Ddye_007617 [Dipteronia dyeriana]|uniref:RNase H type-1 domain-containing protein n=1 Tax=Dipteronia dyeriana TaxID=168575 RepID=A0AAD9XKF3_9ROSI|nr:hypothetical protein Ddye_007617 [Dipteronia dyeriana]